MSSTIQYYSALGTSDTAVITASSSSIALGKIIAINATGSSVNLNLTIHRAQSGNVETLATLVPIGAANAQSMTENRLLTLNETLLLPGDTLHAWASTNAAITLLCF